MNGISLHIDINTFQGDSLYKYNFEDVSFFILEAQKFHDEIVKNFNSALAL